MLQFAAADLEESRGETENARGLYEELIAVSLVFIMTGSQADFIFCPLHAIKNWGWIISNILSATAALVTCL